MYSTIEVDFSIFNSAWWIMIPLIYIYIIDALKFSVNGIVFHNAKTFAVILLFIGYLSVNISANFCLLKMLSTKKKKAGEMACFPSDLSLYLLGCGYSTVPSQ